MGDDLRWEAMAIVAHVRLGRARLVGHNRYPPANVTMPETTAGAYHVRAWLTRSVLIRLRACLLQVRVARCVIFRAFQVARQGRAILARG